MSKTMAVWVIVACALITFMWRVIPFLVFHGDRKMPPILDRLKDLLPAAVMAILVVYGLKGLTSADGHEALAMIIASIFVAGIHIWKKNTILSVFLGTAVYMILLNVF